MLKRLYHRSMAWYHGKMTDSVIENGGQVYLKHYSLWIKHKRALKD